MDNSKRVAFTARLTPETYDLLRKEIYEQNTTYQDVVEEAIIAWLDPARASSRANRAFTDATKDEISALRMCLDLLRNAPDDVKRIFKATIDHWKKIR